MAKSILMSIQPQWVAKILNGEKTIEVRKKFPKDYVGWVYIYCTKTKTLGNIIKINSEETSKLLKKPIGTICGINKGFKTKKDYDLKGKVVGRFWCDKVEEINGYNILDTLYKTTTLKEEELLKLSCLTYKELNDYLKVKEGNYVLGLKIGYAIHISKLEVFDKAKELKDFKVYDKSYDNVGAFGWAFSEDEKYCPLKRAPQNWCYIEGEND